MDIIQNECIAKCDTRNDLHIAWLRYAQNQDKWYVMRDKSDVDFTQLSMNDNDTYTNIQTTFLGYDKVDNPIYSYKKERIVRRFRVLDEDGRTIDIREWPEMKQEPEWPSHNYGWRWYWRGHKRRDHRLQGPAFAKRTNMSVIVEDDDLPAHITAKQLQPRRRKQLNNWRDESYYDRKAAKKWNQKNWKDNCKAKHQWAKHKTRSSHTTIRAMKPDCSDMSPLDILDTIDDSWFESDPTEYQMATLPPTEPDDDGIFAMTPETSQVVILTQEFSSVS